MGQLTTEKTAEIQKGDESLRLSETRTGAYPDPATLSEYERVK
jgi:hypothetical protein